jgi:hypothetical protein
MDKRAVKTIFWDIETSLQLVSVFQLGNNDWIDPSSLVTERYIICASWRVEGEEKVNTVSVLDDPKRYKNDPHDDFFVVSTLRDVLAEADCLVGHNSDSFDLPYLNTRIIYHGLKPLPPMSSVDTYKVSKSKFKFNSNKLDYIAKYLKVGKKLSTTPGLWMKVLKGDKNAIKQMIVYNKHDVVILEKVFKKLIPYIPNYLNRELFGGVGCPRCGSHKVQSRGYHRAISRVYRRFQCQKCFGWFRATGNDKQFSTKSRIL